MPLSSCDWKLLDFRSFICFDVVFFGNGNMAFIWACISETGDSDTRLSWLFGSYLKRMDILGIRSEVSTEKLWAYRRKFPLKIHDFKISRFVICTHLLPVFDSSFFFSFLFVFWKWLVVQHFFVFFFCACVFLGARPRILPLRAAHVQTFVFGEGSTWQLSCHMTRSLWPRSHPEKRRKKINKSSVCQKYSEPDSSCDHILDLP